ncbi:glycosyl transferase family 2 [Kushneria sinocarnis]|uniref:Glycosyl transferase family 2 n=1 Tax=Kushneria sinocarnis TaxID=595502 RepID=A0A420WT70_9GAMM|nr:glycosyltransferase [Kushneria sinocarnis]RKQ95711.1 glycosyl transferase family 2 [Kushneria sinocarnis]
MIGVVVPVHNEQALLHDCLQALQQAALHPALGAEPVRIVAVLDACSDDSARVAAAHDGITVLETSAANVGRARHTGAVHLLAKGARWLSFTDADSRVGREWLAVQLASPGDAICGSVRLDDWAGMPRAQRQRYLAERRLVAANRHVHGANMGVSAEAYRAVGGFEPLCAHEDIRLIQALETAGYHVHWAPALSVMTSARLDARAPEGMAALLKSLQ